MSARLGSLLALVVVAACGGSDGMLGSSGGDDDPGAGEHPDLDTCGQFAEQRNNVTTRLEGCDLGGGTGTDAFAAGLAKAIAVSDVESSDFHLTRGFLVRDAATDEHPTALLELENRGLVARCAFNDGVDIHAADDTWLGYVGMVAIDGGYDTEAGSTCLAAGERAWLMSDLYMEQGADGFAPSHTAIARAWNMWDPELAPAVVLTVDGFEPKPGGLRLVIRNPSDLDLQVDAGWVMYLDAQDRPLGFTSLGLDTAIPAGATLDRVFEQATSYPAKTRAIEVWFSGVRQ